MGLSGIGAGGTGKKTAQQVRRLQSDRSTPNLDHPRIPRITPHGRAGPEESFPCLPNSDSMNPRSLRTILPSTTVNSPKLLGR
jgi:hypothetical protein